MTAVTKEQQVRQEDRMESAYAGKSKFNRDEDIRALIEAGSQQPMVNQANGRRARTFRAGHEIGLDRTTGKQTDLMTVITESDGTLVTAFPGEP